jgi:hypothetical protein
MKRNPTLAGVTSVPVTRIGPTRTEKDLLGEKKVPA